MKSTESPKFEHLVSMLTGFEHMSTRDMMKYAMLNADAIEKEGTSSSVLKVLVSKYLDVSLPNVEQEFN